ncbi:MAG: Mov34/MPN/PAD-1 family protein [Myxococcota bacterium]
MKLPQDLSEVLAHLRSTYPDEGCGLILRKEEETFRVRPMSNAYDRYHAKDPDRFPRTARTAYLFDPKEQLHAYAEAEARGETICCIYHSHCDAGAYFSAEDKVMAAPDGEPILPGVGYLVVAIDQGRPTAAKLFWWEDGNFQEASVPLPL